MNFIAILIVVSTVGAFSVTPRTITAPPDVKVCGYDSCHPIKKDFINVHLVPHTHDDVGWLKTVDQYYYGSRTNIQKAGVQYILDSVVDALKKDVNRRFIYVETAFFWKWWTNQNDLIKDQVKQFVETGQLEFIGGAWSMNDEAVTHYHSIIDQFTWGLRKLNETFGKCGRPKVGWQIDPFGHSREMASLFAQLGFDGLLLGRIDYQDKDNRMDKKSPEMIWRSSANLGQTSDIFTGVMYNTYAPPAGFCFDILCSDDPIIDDINSPDYNVDKKVDDFLHYVESMSQEYSTNNLIMTMGEDFHYQDANMWFKNLDKLIYYGNLRQTNGSKFNLIYSTPSCYIKAVHDESINKDISWPVKYDDFFPYASDPHAYWTGYFTSRPTIKRFERMGNNFLQVCKQLHGFANLGTKDDIDLDELREAMGVMQHHDAITGTEKEHVAHDYGRILQNGIDKCMEVTSSALRKLISQNEPQNSANLTFVSCNLVNISMCSFTESTKKFVVTVYNPLSRPVTQYVRFPVLGEAYNVTDPEGTLVKAELIPIAHPILTIPGRTAEATVELLFIAKNIPPLGFVSYFVEQVDGNNILKEENIGNINTGAMVEFDGDGFVSEVTINNLSLPMNQQFLYYDGFVGDNSNFTNRSSGAYIFRPKDGTAIPVSKTAKIKIYRGELVSEVQQTFNDWISQIIRVYSEENFVEFDWLVGPIPAIAKNGKEVITRFKTNLNTESTFYTDSNGRELLERVKNFRPSWELKVEEPIAGNYYPITSRILIRDQSQGIEVAVLTDRAQGGSSLENGQMELMVHRNCLHDDAFGVGEPLIEEAYGKGLVARGSHYLTIGKTANSTEEDSLAAIERDIAQRKLLSTWTFFSSTMDQTFEMYKKNFVMKFAGLTHNLPRNVQILTLEPWTGLTYLLRLEHVFEKNEDTLLSLPATVDLKGLFSVFDIISVRETTLGANQLLEDNHRLQFNSTSDTKNGRKLKKENSLTDLIITLDPMQIRTFIIEITRRNTM